MKKYLFSLIILILISCSSDLDEYEIQFFPVVKGEFDFFDQNIFTNEPIALKLESRIMYEDRAIEGQFENIILEDLNVYSDRSIIYENQTIEPLTNLNEQPFTEIELINTELNSNTIPDFYIIWLNKELETEFLANNGYFTIYIEGTTENNYEVKDSTLIKIE